jgi:uncharacterized repeat protein (TIGR01451 family)
VGGAATSSDFIIGVTGTNVSTSSFAGSAAGVNVTLDAGAYSVTETNFLANYSSSSSSNCSGSIIAGATKNCTITNTYTAPIVVTPTSTISVVKHVVGGTKLPDAFALFVNSTSVVNGAVNDFPTSTIMYTVSETPDPDYNQAFSVDCDASGQVDLSSGGIKVCIITNTYKTPAVAYSGGGSYNPPVPPLIDVIKVPSPLALPGGPGPVTYTYTLKNIGTVPVNSITMVGDTCKPINLISGDSNKDAKLDVNETWVYTCSTTLLETHTNTVVATGWANGISATDIASATVVVGLPVVPPLIHVTKIPDPLTLPVRGGIVTYTQKVTNPGTVALGNVFLTDDKCPAIKYVSGDTNSDSKLDPNETWTYICRTNLTKTTTNTVTASGEANGLTARDFAIATVVVAAVAVPKLPNTGFSPAGITSWSILLLVGILMLALISTVVILKKRTD